MPDFSSLRAASFRGAAVAASEADFAAAAARLGADAREMHAVISVESAGSGFYKDGRLKCLFEPHVLHRHLTGDKLARAVRIGLAYPKWGTKPYPRDSYPRLMQAMEIDETAALMACSWGLTQILGENHSACGYATPQEMVAAFAAGEDAQLTATADLMASKGLGRALRARDWPAVAKGWNGAAFEKNHYAERLALAFAKASQSKLGVAVASMVTRDPPALPAVAPLSFGQRLAALFAQVTTPKMASV